MLNKVRLILLALGFPILLFSQNCQTKIDGFVEDLGTGLPLEGVNIYIPKIKLGTSTDKLGRFTFQKLCLGEYHIVLSHIGCESQQYLIKLKNDTLVHINMLHSINILDGAIVTGSLSPITTQNILTISEQNISDNANKNLSSMLESISGVSSLKNGSGIAKPIVNGMYGNRLTILNNGVTQGGQQWGNDHSPEIDPLVAGKIRVIKGTSALEYAGSNLGSVILIEPEKIPNEPHIHGKANYAFESNGIGNSLNLQVQQYTDAIAWKINGTVKKSGDKHTPNYFLTNTGNKEANIALQIEKSFSEKLESDFYFSSFNTELGILRGSHIGNLTDLKNSFTRDIPFFTKDNFSYNISAPKQKVNHQLIKSHSKYFITNSQWVDITIAGQLDNRREFDVRRGGRSETPALNLRQYTFSTDVKYHRDFKHGIKLKSGAQFEAIDNTNNPETGILPLIPDYTSYDIGTFAISTIKIKKTLLEAGFRYDNITQNAVTISKSLPRKIIRYNNVFHNINGSLGCTYTINDNLNLSSNLGFTTRNPAINELYSAGLHQGVSGIEEGNIHLKSEKSMKSVVSLTGKVNDFISIEYMAYYQNINNYIFLNPQKEIRLTIRGAFPVFKYEQTDANIYGADISTQLNITESIKSKLVYSFIKGENLTNSIPLINMPSNNISANIVYQFLSPIKIGSKKLENLEIKLDDKYVFKQTNILPSQDFILPPDAYNIVSFKASGDIQIEEKRIRVFLKINNLFNISYRDYLNRQRYFADDLGINAMIGVNMKF